jgi:hypothetical protein
MVAVVGQDEPAQRGTAEAAEAVSVVVAIALRACSSSTDCTALIRALAAFFKSYGDGRQAHQDAVRKVSAAMACALQADKDGYKVLVEAMKRAVQLGRAEFPTLAVIFWAFAEGDPAPLSGPLHLLDEAGAVVYTRDQSVCVLGLNRADSDPARAPQLNQNARGQTRSHHICSLHNQGDRTIVRVTDVVKSQLSLIRRQVCVCVCVCVFLGLCFCAVVVYTNGFFSATASLALSTCSTPMTSCSWILKRSKE